ncbi:hypothetical protein CRUP_033528 [Coryphaenoides rupestris]|nr:hypothetical protein CRUP_033528 [Coryphaenoides rupestris]
MGCPGRTMLWHRYTLAVPVYVLAAVTEGLTVYQAVQHFEKMGRGLLLPISSPNVLKTYLLALTVGAAVSVWQLVKERRHHLDKRDKKLKK